MKYYESRGIINVGAGLIDALTLEQVDPSTGDILGCYKTMNTDQESESEDADEILFDLKAQGINHDIIVNFIDYIEGSKLQLLEKKSDTNYDITDNEYFTDKMLPFIQTDQLVEEIANLKMKMLTNGRVTVEQQVRRIDKDRYSALAYGLWYIKEFEDGFEHNDTSSNIADFLMIN